jgi:general stress protein 26
MALPTTAEEIWPHIEKWPFGVLSFVNPQGESRSAGVMYQVKDRSLYVLTGCDTWKVKHIRANPNVSMTVTIQRLPIRVRMVPPAVITFSGTAEVLDINAVEQDIKAALTRGIDDMPNTCAIKIEPSGHFVTYGIGIPAMQMRHPDKSLARVPVA